MAWVWTPGPWPWTNAPNFSRPQLIHQSYGDCNKPSFTGLLWRFHEMILAELGTHARHSGNTTDPWPNVGCRQLFLILRTRDNLGWIILCLKGFPTRWRMFRHIPGLHPLDVSGTSSSRDNKKVSRCYPMPPRRHRNTAVVWCLRVALSDMVATSYLWWLSPWNVAYVHALK